MKTKKLCDLYRNIHHFPASEINRKTLKNVRVSHFYNVPTPNPSKEKRNASLNQILLGINLGMPISLFIH